MLEPAIPQPSRVGRKAGAAVREGGMGSVEKKGCFVKHTEGNIKIRHGYILI